MPSAKGSPDQLPNVPWGIISVKAQARICEPFSLSAAHALARPCSPAASTA